MPDPFVVAFVPGVTPGKWERIWRERMPQQRLELRPAEQAEALRSLRAGEIAMAFLRDATADDALHVIPLYRERPVVVASRDSVVAAFDATQPELRLDDLSDETVLDGQDAATAELVAANAGVAIMPQSLARALSRRDVVARPLTDAPDTGIGLAWLPGAADPRVETFIGIVRGRTVNSTR